MTPSAYSASPNSRSEDVGVLPVVITELEFGDIQRHIFAAHFVECADNTALEDRPEAFDGLSVDCTDDVLPSGVVNGGVREVFIEALVSGPLIGAKQADFVGDGFANEGGESSGIPFATTRATTLPLRLTAPMIGVFPEPIPPVPPPPRLSQCLFFARPPTKVSSTSTIPPSLSISSMRAVRTLWHMSQAVLYEPKPI
jgi:hypothetical protein